MNVTASTAGERVKILQAQLFPVYTLTAKGERRKKDHDDEINSKRCWCEGIRNSWVLIKTWEDELERQRPWDSTNSVVTFTPNFIKIPMTTRTNCYFFRN